MKKNIEIKVQSCLILQPDSLHDFQGGLKSLSTVNFERLKNSLIRKGFTLAIHVWEAPDGRMMIIDGHQRMRVVKEMMKEGWTIEGIPCVQVIADSHQEAKEKLLAGVSVYGDIDTDELYRELEENQIDVEKLKDEFAVNKVNAEKFITEHYEDHRPEEKDGGGESPEENQVRKEKIIFEFDPIDFDDVNALIHEITSKRSFHDLSVMLKMLLLEERERISVQLSRS
jgi:hypothetical protein